MSRGLGLYQKKKKKNVAACAPYRPRRTAARPCPLRPPLRLQWQGRAGHTEPLPHAGTVSVPTAALQVPAGRREAGVWLPPQLVFMGASAAAGSPAARRAVTAFGAFREAGGKRVI